VKKLRLGLLAFTLTSVAALATANAADMYRAPEPFAGGYKDGPVYTSWAGFYVGVNVGGAWADLKTTEPGDNSWKNQPSDVFGGGQIGYNFQRGNFVFGPEIDLGVLGLSGTATNPKDTGPIGDYSTLHSGFYADVTGRLGYAFDRTLVYAKGGYAYLDRGVSNKDFGKTVTTSSLDGWTLGGGVEYKIAPAWSVKAEYQYFDFGSFSLFPNGELFNNSLTVQTVKAGLNYHVGSVYAPLK
jgi:outer membrane immunogenic protein